RRAAGRVRDEEPIADELGQELQVGRLATAGARAGELEERLEELRALDRGGVDERPLELRQRLEELPVPLRPLMLRSSRLHLERPAVRAGLGEGRAGRDTELAAGAV